MSDAGGGEERAWLLVRGRGERRLEHRVAAEEIRAHASTRRPAVRAGDSAVLYAAGWRVVFGLVDVVSDPEHDASRQRWGWRFALRPRLLLADLREAPPVEAAGVLPRSLGRHSYVRLSAEQLRLARNAIASSLVAAGYDAIADRFAAWQRQITGSRRLERVERLLARLPGRPDVLELGIGAGVRSSRLLAERGRLTGVDVSAEQLARARRRLPGARLLQADIASLDLEPASFDAVVSFYALNHLPRGELAPLLARTLRWLRPGGLFLAALATGDSEEWQGDWLGVPMFFSGFDQDANERIVRESGLELLESELETIVEPEYGEARFHWVLARAPG